MDKENLKPKRRRKSYRHFHDRRKNDVRKRQVKAQETLSTLESNASRSAIIQKQPIIPSPEQPTITSPEQLALPSQKQPTHSFQKQLTRPSQKQPTITSPQQSTISTSILE